MTHRVQGGFAAGPLAGVRRAFADWRRRVAETRAARRTAARLWRMEDHLLRDIGLTRGEAETIARGGRGEMLR